MLTADCARTVTRLLLFNLMAFASSGVMASIAARAIAFQDKVEAAEVVALVKITGLKHIVDAPGGTTCGRSYEADVLERFKGTIGQRLVFSTNGPGVALPFYEPAVGDSMLVLLRHAASTDELPDSALPDVINQKTSASCVQKLSRLRFWQGNAINESSYLIEKRPVVGNQADLWLVFLESRTVLPYRLHSADRPYDAACAGAECLTDPRRIVPWSIMESEIRTWAAR